MNGDSSKNVRMVPVRAADATVFVQVHSRAFGQKPPEGEDAMRLFALVAAALLRAPLEERKGAVSMLAAHANDSEWSRCVAALGAIHPDLVGLSRSIGSMRSDWRWLVNARACSSIGLGPASPWWTLVAVQARMARDLATPTHGRALSMTSFLVGQLVANPQSPHAAMLAAYATDEEWPAMRGCFEQCRVDVAWADAIRLPENAAAVKHVADGAFEQLFAKAGRRMS